MPCLAALEVELVCEEPMLCCAALVAPLNLPTDTGITQTRAEQYGDIID